MDKKNIAALGVAAAITTTNALGNAPENTEVSKEDQAHIMFQKECAVINATTKGQTDRLILSTSIQELAEKYNFRCEQQSQIIPIEAFLNSETLLSFQTITGLHLGPQDIVSVKKAEPAPEKLIQEQYNIEDNVYTIADLALQPIKSEQVLSLLINMEQSPEELSPEINQNWTDRIAMLQQEYPETLDKIVASINASIQDFNQYPNGTINTALLVKYFRSIATAHIFDDVEEYKNLDPNRIAHELDTLLSTIHMIHKVENPGERYELTLKSPQGAEPLVLIVPDLSGEENKNFLVNIQINFTNPDLEQLVSQFGINYLEIAGGNKEAARYMLKGEQEELSVYLQALTEADRADEIELWSLELQTLADGDGFAEQGTLDYFTEVAPQMSAKLSTLGSDYAMLGQQLIIDGENKRQEALDVEIRQIEKATRDLKETNDKIDPKLAAL